jgi:hypothetical protein
VEPVSAVGVDVSAPLPSSASTLLGVVVTARGRKIQHKLLSQIIALSIALSVLKIQHKLLSQLIALSIALSLLKIQHK